MSLSTSQFGKRNRFLAAGMVGPFVFVLAAQSAAHAAPTAQQALQLKPVQEEVEYDQPSGAEMSKCTIKVDKQGKKTGWVVQDDAGRILRYFADTNGNNAVDQWRYFQGGLEVYRDIDSNHNGKADQYRWFHTGGSRWGVDQNEDGRIDGWRMISAEETAAELVEAMKDRDLARFQRLLLSPAELKSLGLGESQAKRVVEKLQSAPLNFRRLVSGQKLVSPASKFVDFGGTQPGVVPAGTDGSTKDIQVYENVAVLVETDGKHHQIQLGTLIRVGLAWRLIDAPALGDEMEVAVGGLFFRGPTAPRPPAEALASNNGPSEEVQKIMAEMDQLDSQAADSGSHKASVHERRTDLLEKLVRESKTDERREQWLKQLADVVSAAVQSGEYPGGVARLQALESKLLKSKSTKDLAAYVKFRRMSAEYGQKLQDPKADFAKIQEQWLKDLESFVGDYPSSPDSAEALLQLAIAEEFAGETEKALKWYARIVKGFPTSEPSKKAAGAQRRLESVGKTLSLRGEGLDGKPIDLADYRGKVVLIQYWATWCEPCKTDMARIKELYSQYAGQGFEVIGVSLDSQLDEAEQYVKSNRMQWKHIYEEGGLDSRPANEMGILTLPTMILVDEKGQVINRSIHITELDGELKRLLK